MIKWIYTFGDGAAEGTMQMRELLGGKGANLAEMCNLGLPVPPGFTISTEACAYYYNNSRQYPTELVEQVIDAIEEMGKTTGRRFGDTTNPLLVSVRSGSRSSMPGMMDTVLNLGLNDHTVESLAISAGNPNFAYDSYRRFISMYSDVVLGIPHHVFEDILDEHKEGKGVVRDSGLDVTDWKTIIDAYKTQVLQEIGIPFPQDPKEQLWGAIGAVFNSWMNNRAVKYRELHGIPTDWGTAVNIQAMVFGNLGNTSATGVAFTRDPSTGERALYGEFLINAQGEDVVAGIRTPQNITKAARRAAKSKNASMEEAMPEAFRELLRIVDILERHYRDMQDMEFTIEDGKLWMLQTRNGKRTATAAMKIVVDLVAEGVISEKEGISRIEPSTLDQILHPTIDPSVKRDIIAKGLPASPGAAAGAIVFSSEMAEQSKKSGRKVILVRHETSPEDIHGMHAAEGILTTRGGMTSHAAVVARGMGKPCVSGAGTIKIDYAAGTLTIGAAVFKAGHVITIDGNRGEVLEGAAKMLKPSLSEEFTTIMGWADKIRRMKIRANAETPLDARQARELGAEGIGLVRTEHMFFEGHRIVAMREMILADDERGRRRALDKLLPIQRLDFEELFEIMNGLPVTIRLLDPPLHEFLPHSDEEVANVARSMNVSESKIRQRATELHEFNPMLGFRGCRLAIAYPEIAEMQARAIFEAAINVFKRTQQMVILEVMVPLVMERAELDFIRTRIDEVAVDVAREKGVCVGYQIGTMVELPRAALRAGEIAKSAKFFSFGTNDLTQTTLGISRDDASTFIDIYRQRGLLGFDPFVTLDQEGVGELIQIGVERARHANPSIKIGVCGEHGGNPASIEFFEKVGLAYVSCSPYRVPIARLAAAQAALRQSPKDAVGPVPTGDSERTKSRPGARVRLGKRLP